MRRFIVVGLAALCLGAAGSALAQTDAYYVTDGDAQRAVRTQGGAIDLQWTTTDNQYPMSIAGTVKIYGTYSNNTGAEYDLDGNPTGVTYPFVGGSGAFLDGTTDGQSRNWACSFSDAGIWQFTQNWTAPTLAFAVPSLPEGITYDPTTDHLWVARSQAAGASQNVVEEYTTSGQLLSSFVYDVNPSNRLGGLAWEPSSGTLWGFYNGQNTVVQFSETGDLLQSIQVPGLASNNWGGEFSMGCKVGLQVQGDVHAPGSTLLVHTHLAHYRPEAVTVPWELRLLDGNGQRIVKRTTQPHTFKPGDVVDRDLQFRLPDDLASGTYTLELAVKGMAGTKGGKTTFRVISAESR
jgi:hypothetical protein